MAAMKQLDFFIFALLLGLFSIIGQVAVDTFLPAMPAVAAGLGTDVGAVQMSLAAIFAGAGVGQLIHGPLSDRFGRKPVIMAALALYVATAIGSSYSANVEALTAWRFAQGLAIAAGRQLANASARDLLVGDRLGRILSYTLVVAAISAIVAPIAAGHLSEAFGWRSVFYYQTGLGILVMVLIGFFFTETLKVKDLDALSPSGLLRNYREILRNPIFLGYSLLGGITLAQLSAFHSTSPQILIQGFGLGPATYGYLFAIVMVGHVIGAWLAGRLVVTYGIQSMLLAGMLISLFSAISTLIPALAGMRHWSVVILPMALLMVGFSFALPQAAAAALTPFPHIAGTAASIAGFTQFIAGAATAAVLSRFDHETQVPLAITLIVLSISGLVLGEILRRAVRE
ncbi:MAG: multidrug effflux MFS transporter [Rhodospirillales bacterium]|jgi:DHA1 family bicyclomycin/chloramphenicol resistance-like MFS transporter|nr:multidrug effflux MFS transporter [Rhodospirillales bacterium]MDP6644974.1 multidrug effflux MFS transporter [Rhodospirillales bacterium]MDP6840660.1 multidrug effflux MFS transporter [Rhodospirillales bacterium]|tara:strand:- start:477 stop:1673 length:1197 start_codon:yes stop_codon:yes gene_type:complete